MHMKPWWNQSSNTTLTLTMVQKKPTTTPLPITHRSRARSRASRRSCLSTWQTLLFVSSFVVAAVLLSTGMIHIHFSTVGNGSFHSVMHSDIPNPPLIHTRESDPIWVIDEEETENTEDHDFFHHPAPTRPSNVVSVRHPCEGFKLPPPPPATGKRLGPRPCNVCYVSVDEAIKYMPTLPSKSPILENLTYYYQKKFPVEKQLANGEKLIGSDFCGYHSLLLRNISFDIQRSMIVPCGFVLGEKPGRGTQFDISDADLVEMDKRRGIVVVSAIFANFDVLQQPKNISEQSKKNVGFYMFVDEETEAYIKKAEDYDKKAKKIGLWRLIVVRNLPYSDARRTGKIPKLLIHRLFPNARYSIWIDGKLELVVDPYRILERFLWRDNATFAISKHYARFDVFVEAEHNKEAGKYNNASIDQQISFYKGEGLTHFSPAKYPITSDVPEGCVIIREHTPITNLFACLWFNEVDRFTSRDQISFSTVRDKIMSQVNWTVDMFEDCERRNFVNQSHHKDLLEKPVLPKNQTREQRKGSVLPRLELRSQPREHGKDQNITSKSHNRKESNIKSN